MEGKDRLAIGTQRAQRGKPIQIRADILDRGDALSPYLARLGVTPVKGDPEPTHRDAHAETGWRDEDLERAIAVAEEAGLTSYRIEIAPDGTITIFVGEHATPGE